MASASQKTVLITGCTPGGIGHSLALTLSQPPYSYRVFATARTESALSALGSKANITPLELDVTDSTSIERLKDAVTAATGGRLDYLINNAGRGYTAPAAEVEMAEVRALFDANLFGVIELCNTFVPLLVATARESRGANGGSALTAVLGAVDFLTLGVLGLRPLNPRPAIVQVGSLAAITPYVFGSIYNASKAALHSYSDTLRLELEPLGVDVVTLFTGGVKSNIVRTERWLRPDSLYTELDKEFHNRQSFSQRIAMPTEVYAKRVARGLTAWNRKDRIWEGGMVTLVWFATTFWPRWALDAYMRRLFGMGKLGRAGARKEK